MQHRNILNQLLCLHWRHLLLELHLDRDQQAQMLVNGMLDVGYVTVRGALLAEEVLVLHPAVRLEINLQLFADSVVPLVFDPVDEIFF